MSISSTKLSKSEEKKASKKLNRALQLISRRRNIDISNDPTKFLLICNAGLVSEDSCEQILALFAPFGSIERIVMPLGESHSFLVFRREEDAMRAMEDVHGAQALSSEEWPRRPLYLSFVNSVPEIENSCDFLPPGLTILEDIVDETIESTLLKLIGWEDDGNEKLLKNRRVKHYGYEFRYDINNVDVDRPLDCPIPSECRDLLQSLIDRGSIVSLPDQLTINEYRPGQGIPSHVDTHSAFCDEILSLSLGSNVVMDFKRPDGRQTNVLLPRRSLLIMSGESRYLWSHGITSRKTDVVQDKLNGNGLTLSYRDVRTSFTFRTLRRDKCNCKYPEKCDSQQPNITTETNVSTIPTEKLSNLESEHVHKVYDVIADHFSNTRHTPWPRVEEFVNSLSIGTLLLDVGCGNGKYLNLNDAVYKIGCDRSPNLMSICSQRGFQGFCCDALRIPVRSDFFDACLCIAVIHHFATAERRTDAVRELSRVLRLGGRTLIYVWALEQRNDATDSNYIKASKDKTASTNCNTESCSLPVHTNRTYFESQDLLVPWHLKSKSKQCRHDSTSESKADVYHRYYHVFRKEELEEMCSTVPSVKIIESYYDKGNWCIILEKQK